MQALSERYQISVSYLFDTLIYEIKSSLQRNSETRQYVKWLRARYKEDIERDGTTPSFFRVSEENKAFLHRLAKSSGTTLNFVIYLILQEIRFNDSKARKFS